MSDLRINFGRFNYLEISSFPGSVRVAADGAIYLRGQDLDRVARMVTHALSLDPFAELEEARRLLKMIDRGHPDVEIFMARYR